MIVAHDSDESLARYGLVEDPALVPAETLFGRRVAFRGKRS